MRLKDKLGQKFVITTELGGTPGTNIEKSLTDIGTYTHIDGLNVIDCASARLRINSFALAHLIQLKFPDLNVTPHLTCRDRSILGLQSDLIGAHALGIRYVLATTGDPPKEGPYKESKAVFNVTSIQLIKMINNLNKGLDYNDKEIKGETDFFISAVTPPGAPNLDAVIKRMRNKIEAGANFFQTQPMYDIEKTKNFFKAASALEVPILLGIMPLKSIKMANFMNENVAGIDIPASVLEKINSGVQGTEIAKEFIEQIYSLEGLSGIHIMALGNVEATNELIGFVDGLLK